jgi:ParB family chromosome partitioning protein
MTSGKFELLSIQSITVDRENRQRRDLIGLEELAASIQNIGLINPIVITRDLELVAGERRLEAHKLLGFDTIAVQYAEDLDQLSLHLIELEENIRRTDLPWQDHVKAVCKYHEIKTEQAQEINEEWSQSQTAEELGMSKQVVGRHLLVNRAMVMGVNEVLAAPKFSQAANFAERAQERRKTAVLRDLRQQSLPEPKGQISSAELVKPEIPTGRYADIVEENFIIWSKTVQEIPYNLIHCDFPYGVNAGDTQGQSAAKGFGGYEDKPEIYFSLLDTLLRNQNNFIAPSAHMIFWFSLDFYIETREKLMAAGWRVDLFPLIWFKSDNTGILPDAQRGPRRVYETAFFCVRGDRKVVRAVGNCTATGVTKTYHMSEKPTAVLHHFFRMLVDETTVMLDPTCGSGNAVKVAEELGADWSLGLEINVEYMEAAKQNLGL